MEKNYYTDGKFSIFAMCNQFDAELADIELTMFDFDAHATLHQLPHSYLLGPAEYAVDRFIDEYIITCMIGVCTDSDDTQLADMDKITNHIFKRLRPGNMFPLYDAENRIQHGKLKVLEDVMVAPIARNNEGRPFIGIGVRLSVAVVPQP